MGGVTVRFSLLLATLLILVLGACSGDDADPGSTIETTTSLASANAGDPERGREIWDSGGDVVLPGCSECHSLDGTEDPNHLGPSWQGISDVAGDRVSGLSTTDYLRQSIVDPSAYIVEGYRNGMPASFGLLLSEEDIDGLIAFLLTL